MMNSYQTTAVATGIYVVSYSYAIKNMHSHRIGFPVLLWLEIIVLW